MTINIEPINFATETFLDPNGLTVEQLSGLMGDLYIEERGFGDFYFQTSRHESWILEDGIVREGSYSHDCGVGVRAVCGERTGFSYSDDLSYDAISMAVKAARKIKFDAQPLPIKNALSKVDYSPLYTQIDPLDSISTEQKLATLRRIDQIARDKDSRIKEVTASLNSLFEVIMVMATDGTLAADIRPMVRLSVSVIAEDSNGKERGSSGGGGRISMVEVVEDEVVEKYVSEAVEQALTNLKAKHAPAGQMPVVLGNGWPGVMLHEAVGHGLEGDFNRKGSSNFSGLIGEKVASELCTVVDDGSIANRRGSLSIDDEGVKTQPTKLIENGILKTYMQDKRNAILMDMPLTGNGRRESYAHLPMPRMTNTYLEAGKDKVEDMIASIDHGIYAVNFGGGQVDITSGKFVFVANKAFLIEKGKISHPVKGVTLIGNGPDIMNKVCMLGDDLALDTGVGVCGKAGQSVPVGVGQPSLKISEITVGGTS